MSDDDNHHSFLLLRKEQRNIFKWKFEIGEIVNHYFKITDKYTTVKVCNTTTKTIKHYKYTCMKCGYTEGDTIESCLCKTPSGCEACCIPPRKVVQGINDIPTTAPWMVKYFSGGYDEAKLYTSSSSRKIYPICPDCGKIKDKPVYISNIQKRNGFKCSYCSDGISFPEKFILCLLKQLNIDCIYQLSKSDFNWCKNYRYDFYIRDKNMIIETHGEQHYIDKNVKWGSLGAVQENDNQKRSLALINSIDKYIVLDCKESQLEYIRNSVMNSELPNILNFVETDVDWYQCFESSIKSIVKSVCNDWNKGNETSISLSKTYKLSKITIINYLKQGHILNWCEYNPRNEMVKRGYEVSKNNCKKVIVIKDGVHLGIFNSISELCAQSLSIYNVSFNCNYVGMSCSGKIKSYKGFTFKYV